MNDKDPIRHRKALLGAIVFAVLTYLGALIFGGTVSGWAIGALIAGLFVKFVIFPLFQNEDEKP